MKTPNRFSVLSAGGLILTLGVSPASAQVPTAAQAFEATQPAVVDSTAGLFRSSDLAYAAMFFGSLIAIEPLESIDASLSPDSLPTGFAGDLFDAGDTLGKGYVSYGLSGMALLGGELFGSSRLSRVGLRAIGALVASDAIVFPAKVAVGRRRPSGDGRSPDEFDSFAFEREFYSFPSGHTAHAFALAGVVSDEFSDGAPWVRYVAYSVATATGVSRLLGREHWATDVIAGAAAGVFASKLSARVFGGRGAERGIAGAVQPILSVGGGDWIAGVSVRF